MANDQTFMDVSVFTFGADVEAVHCFSESDSVGVEVIQSEIGINDGVDVEAITEDPLFVAPVAGWLLGNHDEVVGALVAHPGQRLLHSFIEE